MILLDRAEIENLLALVSSPEDRKTLEAYFQIIEKIHADHRVRKFEKRAVAKQVTDLMIRAGLEISKHAAITMALREFHLLD